MVRIGSLPMVVKIVIVGSLTTAVWISRVDPYHW
jgi:hypothetical protein